MKKFLIIPLLGALLTGTAASAVYAESPGTPTLSAASTAHRLSPALDVLATGLTLTKTGLVSKEITFSPLDFESLLGVGYLSSITVLTLPDPTVGTLYLETTPVMKNQVISRSSLSALRFVPATDGAADCSFVFGTVSTSQPLALSCVLRLTEGLNFAPETATQPVQKVSTLTAIPVYGRLSASDPEGDRLTYRITDYPDHGTLKMIDRSAGEYCYTPISGFVGSDGFTFVAVDEYGNASAQMTVSLTVEERTTAVTYCDMVGSPALLSAIQLAESGVMIGETIGASAYFHPNQGVSRAEFLAMTLCAAGIELPMSAEKTTFADDGQIPAHLRHYVSYAAKQGYVMGNTADQTGYFEPNRTITYAEAAVMLKSVLGLTAEGVTSVFADEDSVPAWAESAVWAVAEAGLFPDGVFAADSAVSRGDAAIMLAGVLAR